MAMGSAALELCTGYQDWSWGQFPWSPFARQAAGRRRCTSSSNVGLRSCKFSWSLPDDPELGRPGGYGRGVTAETVSQLCRQGHFTQAVEALGVLVQAGCCVSRFYFYTVLKKCVVGKEDLHLGCRVHALTVKAGYQSDAFLCNHILRMYAFRGRLEDAMDVFAEVAEPDSFMWSSIISAHVKHGHGKKAIELYRRMRKTGVEPDGHVFVAALQACASGLDLETGQQVHADVLGSGVEPDLFVCNCLVGMYAKCGNLEDARGVFDGLGEKDVVTWTALIAGYSQQGKGQEALRLYGLMLEEGMAAPNCVTFVSLLQACVSVGSPALETGKELHAQIRERGYHTDAFVASSLVNMYAKCGSVEDAQRVFDGLFPKDVVTWNAMLAGYSQQGMGREAIYLYSVMLQEGITAPNSVTFVCLLQACAIVGNPALEMGKQIHADIVDLGYQADVFVANGLVDMYAKCGSLEEAHKIFDGLGQKGVVTWNTLISGYSQQGMGQEALRLYGAMQEEGIAAPTCVTFMCLLQACASLGTPALETGKQLHAQMRDQGHQADSFLANGLVNMYVKCGSLEEAERVFEGLSEKDEVTWTSIIAGYSQQGLGHKALTLYNAMQEEGIAVPDCTTFVCLLQACANVAALHLGRQLHAQIVERGLHRDLFVAASLINMYGKSGSMDDAQQVFDALPERDVVTWSALIAGYTCQGYADNVFNMVQRMREDGIHPVGITFLSVLTACSHAGLVIKGKEYLEAMDRQYNIIPTVEHYTCMIDLLGRLGRLDEALAVIRTMPVLPNAAVWHTVLGACQKWSNVEVGRHAFDEVVKLDKANASAYVLMSNIYTGTKMLEKAQDMQACRIRTGAWKYPGQSWWTDLDGIVHSFLAGEMNHPKIQSSNAETWLLQAEVRRMCVASELVLVG